MKPTLALCIPAYNAAKYLPRLLTSAHDQKIIFDEILVYNDCSDDNTEDIAKSYGAKVINGVKNVGCSTGKNKLANATKCDWIHFHDADDDLLPNFSEVAYKWITKDHSPDIILLHYEYREFQTNRLLGEPKYDLNSLISDPVKFTIENKIVNFALIKKEPFLNIGGFDLDTKVLYNEDKAFYTKASLAGLSFDYDPELCCLNYKYEDSMSNKNQKKCVESAYYVLEKIASQAGNIYPKEIAHQLWINAASATTHGVWDIADKCIELAISLNGNTSEANSPYFNKLCKLNPYLAIRIRELFIRIFKPYLR